MGGRDTAHLVYTSHAERAVKTTENMNRCYKCKTRITTHLWVVGETAYCSPSCQRGGKSQFEKLYKALDKMRKETKN